MTTTIYQCPQCGIDIPVGDWDDDVCCDEGCGTTFEVDHDAEYDDGRWHDLTVLRATSYDPRRWLMRWIEILEDDESDRARNAKRELRDLLGELRGIPREAREREPWHYVAVALMTR